MSIKRIVRFIEAIEGRSDFEFYKESDFAMYPQDVPDDGIIYVPFDFDGELRVGDYTVNDKGEVFVRDTNTLVGHVLVTTEHSLGE